MQRHVKKWRKCKESQRNAEDNEIEAKYKERARCKKCKERQGNATKCKDTQEGTDALRNVKNCSDPQHHYMWHMWTPTQKSKASQCNMRQNNQAMHCSAKQTKAKQCQAMRSRLMMSLHVTWYMRHITCQHAVTVTCDTSKPETQLSLHVTHRRLKRHYNYKWHTRLRNTVIMKWRTMYWKDTQANANQCI